MFWETLCGDVGLAIRLLRRAPGPTALSIVAIAIAIGTGTAMFGVLDGVLLRPLPYAEPDRLVRVGHWQSYPDLQDWINETTLFRGFGGFRPQTFDRETPAGTDRIPGALVTGDLFDVLGVRAHRGRLITHDDDKPGGEHVAVVSYGFWRRALGGRDEAIGERLAFLDGSYRIIGVLPEGVGLWFTPADVIAAATAESTEFGFRGVHSLTTVGRLAEGAGLAAAQQEMDALAARLAARYPEQNRDQRFPLAPLAASLVEPVAPMLFLVGGAVALVWLIACLNVTNLQVGRAIGRRAEMATRRAVGATRLQLLRQLVVEQLVLAAIAAVAGIVIAGWLIELVRGLPLAEVPRLDAVSLDARVLAFAVLLSAATVLVAGVLPAMSTIGRDVGQAAGHGLRISSARRRAVAGLLVAEIAATAALMIGGGLLFVSYRRLMHVSPGFDPDSLVTFNLTLRPLPRTPAPGREPAALVAERSRFFNRVIDVVSGIPGVTAVAASTDLPIAEGLQNHNLNVEGRDVAPGAEPSVYYRGVNPGFFRAFGLPLLRGRDFTATDAAGAPLVAVVNDTFARTHYPGADPIGKRIRWSGSLEWITIVGVASDVKSLGLDVGEVPAVYAPFSQDDAAWRRYMDFAVRTTVDPSSVTSAIRIAVASVDRTVPVTRLQSMQQLIAGSVLPRRLMLWLLSVFALAGLTLAAIGLYGAMSYAVRARAAELGLRLALGASPSSAVRLVLRQAVWCLVIGVTLGVAVAAASVNLVRGFLFQIAGTDLATYIIATAGVAVVALVSAVIPAARAARIDPLIVLRRG